MIGSVITLVFNDTNHNIYLSDTDFRIEIINWIKINYNDLKKFINIEEKVDKKDVKIVEFKDIDQYNFKSYADLNPMLLYHSYVNYVVEFDEKRIYLSGLKIDELKLDYEYLEAEDESGGCYGYRFE